MKKFSIRWKIIVGFSIAIIFMTVLTMVSELMINEIVIQKGIQDTLIEMVENNIDEVEFYEKQNYFELDNDQDLYIPYHSGYLEIDDDYLEVVNGIYTALYKEDGTLIYGENPITEATKQLNFLASKVQTVKENRVKYYVYDQHLEGENLEDMWLRGIVSEKQGTKQFSFAVKVSLILLPTFAIVAVIGTYFLTDYCLSPIKKIQDTVDSIREGEDLTKRIGLEEGNDELYKLANTFDAMFDRIENVFQSQQKFISDASHELRTPVTVILSQCEYALEEPQIEEEYIEALELIQRQGKKISIMVNELLTITRLEQNKERYKKDEIDFSSLVYFVCQDMALIKEKKISVESEIEKGIFVHGNEELLIKLLNNLIVNGYRYGKQNGHIYVELKEEREEIQLSIADDGIGIAESDLEQIWNRFYQADTSRTGQGTGLGLSIVKEIATFHKGKMTVESKVGEGSKFILHLPK